VAWLLAQAERRPVLAVWEDLHWADPSTLELLGLIIDQVPTARLLMLVTYRPEFRPPWAPGPTSPSSRSAAPRACRSRRWCGS
jgi:predicted ATPase